MGHSHRKSCHQDCARRAVNGIPQFPSVGYGEVKPELAAIAELGILGVSRSLIQGL